MSWHYLQGREAASWEGSSWDGAPYALLKLMPTAEMCCSRGNERATKIPGTHSQNWTEKTVSGKIGWWPVDLLQGVDDGMAYRMERVAATGNGQVPAVVAMAWKVLTDTMQP